MATRDDWREHLGRVRVEGGLSERRTIFSTALYHSLPKPCFAPDESPFWPIDGPFVFDVCTMWDIYKTQLPLLTTIGPDRSVELHADLRRTYGEDFLDGGVAHPITHTLDLAYRCHCTAQVARRVGDTRLASVFEGLAQHWSNAFDPTTGLLVDSTFYEGGRWNYSFRLLHDMAARIALAGGDDAFVELLDRFFGMGAPPVEQLGEPPFGDEVSAGYSLDLFEGLNNEPDMEAPYAYHYAGRPDRASEIVQSVLDFQFGTGRGGLPGNDDSGGLSSWYVWASLGLFPVAGQQVFLLDTPAFAHARVRTGESELVIETDGHIDRQPGDGHQYVQAAWLDGRPLDRAYLTGAELHRSERLRLCLGDTPTEWGRDVRPPSISAVSVRPTSSPEPSISPEPSTRR